ncbi:MAG: hypothetical protein GY716_17765 [bacterium]|nr:hypothetical protein [bacterium]
MSLPRRIVPGSTYLLTRRCFGRHFFLRPSHEINQIFEFCLAVAAARSGCEVHAYCVMSNHYHLVVTDVEGELPVFMHWLNEYVAKCTNSILGRWESFWAPQSYSQVLLESAEDVLGKIVYTLTNPTSAGLVAHSDQWPGARSRVQAIGGPERTVDRPAGFFRPDGPVPPTEQLALTVPPALADYRDWRQELEQRISARETEVRQEFRAKNSRFLGRRRILRQSPTARPTGGEPRRGLNPRVAARNKWRRIETLQRLKQFVSDYREAWRQYAEGDHRVVFPFGTYAMRIQFQVRCCGP